ncbi:MAG: permease-like cell division protein FtsX [bacterium]|nr:permease-like cell division protein FtsX [bacterium]
MMRSFGFFLKETLDGIRRHSTGSLVTFVQVFMSLFFLGLSLIIIININNIVGNFLNNLEMGAFLDDNITYEQAVDLINIVEDLPGVREVTYVSKEEAFAFVQQHTTIDISDLLAENPLPASLKITVNSPRIAEELKGSIVLLDGVNDVRYGEAQLQTILPWLYALELISFYASIFLTWFALITIANTIRLAILNRQKEIKIMQLVGATSWFIRLPFLIEGLIYGIIGAALAIGIIAIGYNLVLKYVTEQFIFTPITVDFNMMIGNLAIMVFVLGAFVGVIASLIAVDKHLSQDVYSSPRLKKEAVR